MAAHGRPPELTPEASSSLISRYFPFQSISLDTFKPLPSYDDRNVYFTGTLQQTGNGAGDATEESFVLKLYNRNMSTPAVQDGLNILMLRLSERGIPCSRPIASRKGDCAVETELGDGLTYTIKILRFIPGVVMDKLEKKYLTPELSYSVGKLIGKMDFALQVYN